MKETPKLVTNWNFPLETKVGDCPSCGNGLFHVLIKQQKLSIEGYWCPWECEAWFPVEEGLFEPSPDRPLTLSRMAAQSNIGMIDQDPIEIYHFSSP